MNPLLETATINLSGHLIDHPESIRHSIRKKLSCQPAPIDEVHGGSYTCGRCQRRVSFSWTPDSDNIRITFQLSWNAVQNDWEEVVGACPNP